MSEPFEDLAELVQALKRAVTLEHWLVCQYLFMAFSVRMPADKADAETWEPEHFVLAQRIRTELLFLARHEMKHMGDIANLLLAIGEAPVFDWRFLSADGEDPPVAPGLLSPLSADGLERLALVELPPGENEEIVVADAELQEYFDRGFADLYERITATVERRAFDLPFRAGRIQLTNEMLEIRPAMRLGVILTPIRNTDEAEARLGAIANEGWSSAAFSHYQRLRGLKFDVETNAAFTLAEPVVRSPIIETTKNGVVLQGRALEIAKSGGAVYRLILLLLDRTYTCHEEDQAGRRYLARFGLAPLMEAVLRPLGEELSRTPVFEGSSRNAGLTFEIPSRIELPADRSEAWAAIDDAFRTAAEAVSEVSELPDHLSRRMKFLSLQYRQHLEAGLPEGS